MMDTHLGSARAILFVTCVSIRRIFGHNAVCHCDAKGPAFNSCLAEELVRAQVLLMTTYHTN